MRIHEGNGRPALFSTLGYVQGVAYMEDDEIRYCREIHEHQIDDAVTYRHRWEPDMAVVDTQRAAPGDRRLRATTGFATNDDRSSGRQRSQLLVIAHCSSSEPLPQIASRTTCHEHDGERTCRAEVWSHRHRRCRQPRTAAGSAGTERSLRIATVEVLEVRVFVDAEHTGEVDEWPGVGVVDAFAKPVSPASFAENSTRHGGIARR